MPAIVPTIEQIEGYLDTIEDVVRNSLHAATPDLPKVSETIHRLWEDILRHSPQAISSLPSLGPFEVPPPPPPSPPQPTDWLADHPWTIVGVGAGLIGAGLLAGYAYYPTRRGRVRLGGRRHVAGSTSTCPDRKQVVVVLGGDHPLALPLILDLEKKGYIVVASVSSPHAVDDIEGKCHGYVRALVLDPSEPDMTPFFLRSLASTMSRRFPINAAGDPHAAPSTTLYLHSVISLLTLPAPGSPPAPAPLEHLALREAYLPYLQATHITPLHVLQALLPMLRGAQARAAASHLGRQSIVVCLPATDAHVGLPFAGAQAMGAAATLRGVDVLRRELSASETMRDIRVVTVDVGTVGPATAITPAQETVVEKWTPSERAAYGAAFAAALGHGSRRQPSDVAVFVDAVVGVVGGRRHARGACFGFVARCGLGPGGWRAWRGDRVIVGAGARTYALAARLPSVLLDALLQLPYVLMSIRNAILPIVPTVVVPPPAPTTNLAPAPPPAEKRPLEASPETDSDPERDASEAGSEADVESNEGGYGSGVGESWVSLKP